VTKYTYTIDQIVYLDTWCKMQSRCFGIMGGDGNFAFNLVSSKTVKSGYDFLSLRL
jgi:hypothetical protein